MNPYVLYDKERMLQNLTCEQTPIQNRPMHFSSMKFNLEYEKHTEIILDSKWHSKHYHLSSFGAV